MRNSLKEQALMTISSADVVAWCEEILAQAAEQSFEGYVRAIPPVSELTGLPSGTRVLVRGDVDAGIKDERVVDDVRPRSMLETLRFGVERGWVQIIFGHRGRDPELSLRPVAECFEELLGQRVAFVGEWMNSSGAVLDAAAQEISVQSPGSVVLLENTRRYPLERALWKARRGDLPGIAGPLATLLNDLRDKVARVEINEGFSASNPDVSSAVVPAAMDRVALGFYLHEELTEHVSRAREAQLVVFSGLKIEKLSDLESILDRGQVRMVIAAGSLAMALKMAAAKLDGAAFSIGKAGDERYRGEKYYIAPERVEQAERMITRGRDAGVEFVLPVDFVLADGSVAESIPPDGQQLDVGPASSEFFARKVGEFIAWHGAHQSQTGRPAVAFHNGVFGKFEDAQFETGTRRFMEQLKRLHEAGVAVYVGGGEGGAALEKYGASDWVSHLFTAGGTILKALGTDPIPYLQAMWMVLRRSA
jgi:phosphoglycerate kinase